jgi:hypothetical protein
MTQIYEKIHNNISHSCEKDINNISFSHEKTVKKFASPPVAIPPPFLDSDRNTHILNPYIKSGSQLPDNAKLNVALDTNANKVVKRKKGRSNTQHLKHTSMDTAGGRICHCGVTPISNNLEVTISMHPDGNHHFSGLQTCGSVWICPTCSLKISKQRHMEVYNIMKTMLVRPGVSIGHLTLTVAHSDIQSLKTVKNRLLNTWRIILQSREYRDMADKYKHLGDIRALEIKVNRINGWHPHLHIAIFAECSDNRLMEFGQSIMKMWIKRHKGNAGIKGQWFTPVYNENGISEYITKWDLASEITLSNMKIDRDCTDKFTPWDLLQGVAIGNDTDGWKKKMFKDYANETKGARQLSFSKEIRKLHNQGGAKSDEEISKEEQGSTEVIKIDKPLFRAIAYHRLQAHALNAMEFNGMADLQILLMEFGLFTTYREKGNILCLDEPTPG